MQTIDYSRMIAQFMDKNRIVRRDLPEIVTEDEIKLRRTLVEEEALELSTAMSRCFTYVPENTRESRIEEQSILSNISKEIADLLYVTFGAALVFGIPIEAVIEEVHRSNMSKPKLGHDNVGNKREKGMYSPAQIAAVITPYLRRRREEEKRKG